MEPEPAKLASKAWLWDQRKLYASVISLVLSDLCSNNVAALLGNLISERSFAQSSAQLEGWTDMACWWPN